MAEPVNLDGGNFKGTVVESKIPFLVDFWAPWCAPCRNLAPIVDELAGEYSGRMGFGKVNVDENSKIATEYGIRSMPTLLIFKDGKPAAQIVGMRPKAELKKQMDAVLSDKS